MPYEPESFSRQSLDWDSSIAWSDVLLSEFRRATVSSLGSAGGWWIPTAPGSCCRGAGFNDERLCSFQNPALFHEKKKRKDYFWKRWFISAATFRNNASCQSLDKESNLVWFELFFSFFFLSSPCRQESNWVFNQVKVENQENSERHWLDIKSIGDSIWFQVFWVTICPHPLFSEPFASSLLVEKQQYSSNFVLLESISQWHVRCLL